MPITTRHVYQYFVLYMQATFLLLVAQKIRYKTCSCWQWRSKRRRGENGIMYMYTLNCKVPIAGVTGSALITQCLLSQQAGMARISVH